MTGARRRHRLLAAAVASVLFLATVLGITRVRGGDVRPADDVPSADRADEPSATPSVPPSPPAPTPTTDPARSLADPDAAAARGADGLLADGLATAQGPWRALGDPAWPTRGERPVYVGAVILDPAGERVAIDLVVATRLADAESQLVLRLLPAARALGDGTELAVDVTVDGLPVEVDVDRHGARLVVPLGRERRAGEAVLLRLAVGYRLVPTAAVVDDGGPAAFGLLADHGDVAALGHWLPLLTLPGQAGPVVSWGDVGGFPVAVWSLRVTHDGVLVTGGADEPCPGVAGERRCTRSRGIALRDVSAALLPEDAVVAAGEVDGVRHRAVAADGTTRDAEAVLAEAAAASTSFASRFGPLAWRELDTVSVPLGRGAAGMEFPGLSFVDDEQWTAMDGAFGTAVLLHEVAHQWFHALVGNGSLSDPVVDESLAQYLSVLAWRDRFGDEAARVFAQRAMAGRYAAARANGVEEVPPARPLDAFPDADSYGAMVYARAPLAWVLAEDRLGAAAVEAFLGQVVSAYGLGVVTDEQLLADAEAFDPALGGILHELWVEEHPRD